MTLTLCRRFGQVWQRAADRFLDFKPYIKPLSIGGHRIRFFYGTPQGADWYDPLLPHHHAEFDWILDRLGGRGEKIIDAGAYHGLYTLVLARGAGPGSEIVAVDPVPWNRALIEVNLALNRVEARIDGSVIDEREGIVSFAPGSCGRVVPAGGEQRTARRLTSLMPDATVVKLDIEGAEFRVVPGEIDRLPDVHTWIVEIHPGADGEAEVLLDRFRERGFSLLRLNRNAARVEPVPEGVRWTERTSMIALRP
jgi:FkbM family methyltransferase